jgi:hypothetical protein
LIFDDILSFDRSISYYIGVRMPYESRAAAVASADPRVQSARREPQGGVNRWRLTKEEVDELEGNSGNSISFGYFDFKF